MLRRHLALAVTARREERDGLVAELAQRTDQRVGERLDRADNEDAPGLGHGESLTEILIRLTGSNALLHPTGPASRPRSRSDGPSTTATSPPAPQRFLPGRPAPRARRLVRPLHVLFLLLFIALIVVAAVWLLRRLSPGVAQATAVAPARLDGRSGRRSRRSHVPHALREGRGLPRGLPARVRPTSPGWPRRRPGTGPPPTPGTRPRRREG